MAVKLPRPGGALYAFEDAVYRRLEEHPGIAPAYIGRFVLHHQHPEYCSRDVIILERWGKQIDSFSELKRDERVHIFDLAKRLHLEVKLKLDIRPRNVLRDREDKTGNRFRLIDFERADYHDCPGEGRCTSLKSLKKELNLRD